MKTRGKRCLNLLAALSSSAFLMGQATSPGEVDEDPVIELSPFVVSEQEQQGYVANSTLAGTRIKTDVKDVGASVSIYTQEFLEDIDGNSLEDVLRFTTNTEVAGVDGNFAGFTGENNTTPRVEPAASNRIRGLARATLTRNYVNTDIPFDSYNSFAVPMPFWREPETPAGSLKARRSMRPSTTTCCA